jgi:hypothetical protein
MDISDETVTYLRHRLDELRVLVAECLSETIQSDVQAVVEVDVCIGPQGSLDFVSGNDTARVFEQHREQPQRLIGQPDGCSALRQPPCVG